MRLTKPIFYATGVGGLGMGSLSATALSGISLSSQGSTINSQREELKKLQDFKNVKSIENIVDLIQMSLLKNTSNINNQIDMHTKEIKRLQEDFISKQESITKLYNELRLKEERINNNANRLCWIFDESNICYKSENNQLVKYIRQPA